VMSGEDVDVYEQLPEGVSLLTTASAGAAAGITEHVCMYPVDVVKTRQQALACDKTSLQSRSILRNISHIWRTEGPGKLVQGCQAMALGAGPAHAIYFAVYEKVKAAGEKNLTFVPDMAVHAGAGAAATVFHDGVMAPADVVKQRMQMCCSPHRKALTCARTIYRNEGIAAFYRAYPTMLTMSLPFQIVNFVVYEKMKKITNPNKEYKPWTHWLSGAVAGGLAAFFTMPLDVCKTLLNTQEANVLSRLQTSRVVGMRSAALTVYSMHGFMGFFRGLWAKVLYQTPSTAISWSVYEYIKWGIQTYGSGGYNESTLEDLRKEEVPKSVASEKEDLRFWDSTRIVTELPRAVLAEGVPSTELVVPDRTLPGYRT